VALFALIEPFPAMRGGQIGTVDQDFARFD
jgi:hypothetical protein